MVKRYRPKNYRANNGRFIPGVKVDGRSDNGRPPGAENKLPRNLKEAIVTALTMLGEDGKGKEGLVGYFMRIGREDMGLATQLVLKIIPTQLTGAGGGPVQVMNIPPEFLKDMPTEELHVLGRVLERIGGQANGRPPLIEHQPGDASAYAKEIGLEPATTNGKGY